VSHAKVARLARWRKHRAGGIVWYLDCGLAEGYVGLAPICAPKALPEAIDLLLVVSILAAFVICHTLKVSGAAVKPSRRA
jgi:hypothetical protein